MSAAKMFGHCLHNFPTHYKALTAQIFNSCKFKESILSSSINESRRNKIKGKRTINISIASNGNVKFRFVYCFVGSIYMCGTNGGAHATKLIRKKLKKNTSKNEGKRVKIQIK